MKKQIISAVSIVVLGISLSACKKEVKFADEIFYNPLESLSGDGTDILTPTRVTAYLADNIFYEDCNLLENREGYIKFECGPVYEHHEPKPKNYRMDFVIYEVVPPTLGLCRYEIRRTDIWRNTGKPSLISFYCIK